MPWFARSQGQSSSQRLNRLAIWDDCHEYVISENKSLWDNYMGFTAGSPSLSRFVSERSSERGAQTGGRGGPLLTNRTLCAGAVAKNRPPHFKASRNEITPRG